jgi:hypothetical protein
LVENSFRSKDGTNIGLPFTSEKMDCEEGRWIEIAQGLFLQSWVSFTLKKVE